MAKPIRILGSMAKNRKKRKKRKSGGIWRKLPFLAAAVLAAYGAWSQEKTVQLGPSTQRAFAAFARLEVTPTQFARMRESPVPPFHMPKNARWFYIADVLDGDTIRLDDGTTVRLLGIDAPESSENRKLYTDLGKMNIADAKGDLLGLGKRSKRAAEKRAAGRRCWLETDRNARDQYGRVLAVVHLEDGCILNEWLLSEGYAKAHLADSFTYRKRYIALQYLAQRNQKGFWSGRQEQ